MARKDPEVTNVGREVPSRSDFSANLAQHGRRDAPQIAKERTQARLEATQGCLIAPNRQFWELRDDFEGDFSGQMATTCSPNGPLFVFLFGHFFVDFFRSAKEVLPRRF